MRYRYSELDRKNLKWFKHDLSKTLLHAVRISEGHIRGLSNIALRFTYPITAIAGRNGSGKSTALALVCCAFHNDPSGFNPKARKFPYYTFSDFFIQSSEEVPPDGIVVHYLIAHDDWEIDSITPDGKGICWTKSEKKKNGRWSNYEFRIYKNVIFFGIDRVVPHYEKTVSRSYRKVFAERSAKGWEDEVGEIVGRILSRKYDRFTLKEHTRYKLPVVKVGGTIYSGFNMGAGENALFDIISTILSGPKGMLIVIDEIELGLHEEAQRRLIEELKAICLRRSCQVVCTTHSSQILDSIPPEGRIFIERSSQGVRAIPEISSAYASGKLAGIKSNELEIFVEDEVAKEIVETALSAELRSRVKVTFIGSDAAIARQIAATFRERDSRNICAVFDGDKSSNTKVLERIFLNTLESLSKDDRDKAEAWFQSRISFLPGGEIPEKWILKTVSEIEIKLLAEQLGIHENELRDLIESAIDGEPHSEFPSLASKLFVETEKVRQQFIVHLMNQRSDYSMSIRSFLQKLIN